MTRSKPSAVRRLLHSSISLAALGGLGLGSRALAEPAPLIGGAPQLFVQRGQVAEITVDGQNLASISSVALTHPRGLRVSLIEPAKGAKPDNGHLHLHLSADADAGLDERELRLIGPGGVSAPIRISVGQYPQVAEREPNNNPDDAQAVTFPATLVGKVDQPGDIDCFRFSAMKGQHLIFDVHAVRSRSQLDPLVTIHNEAGHELRTGADLHNGDPTVIFEVPADGRYILSVRDLQYRGGGDFTYRIDAGALPYVQSVLPMSVQPGRVVEVRPIGVNLTGAANIPLDLTYAAEGQISVRAQTPGGISNAVKVDVNETPGFADEKPAFTAELANIVSAPVDISGRIDQTGNECFFKFHIARKQGVTLEAIAKAMGSPMDPLLTLRSPTGAPMQTVEAAGGSSALISRELEPGDYIVSIRDLFFHGGPRYAYRLQVRAGASAAQSEQGFSFRYLPDALRISPGSNAIVFVDLQRQGEFKGDVTISVDNLPPGVTCPPLVMNEKLPGASGMLVLSAAPGALTGNFPIRLHAAAMVGTNLVTHEGTATLDGRDVDQAYLTVLEPATFTIEPIAGLTAERVQQLSAEADALSAKVTASNAEIEAAQAAWEKSIAQQVKWKSLEKPTITASAGSQFKVLPDDSILAGKSSPERDTYTVTATTDLANFTAVRLETLTDPSLPGQGPGRSQGGNFVLSHFTLTIAPKDDAAKAVPVVFKTAVADVEQEGYPVIDAIQPKSTKGWAMFPKVGNPNQAIFFTDKPIAIPKDSVLTFTLDQQFGQQHTLGRFRISLTNDAKPASSTAIPIKIAKVLDIPADKRSPEQKAQIASYYRTIDPKMGQVVSRLAAIRQTVGVQAEIARLEKELATDSPEINAQREKWEKAVEAGLVWQPLDISVARSKSGATLTKEPDDSVVATGMNPANDVYTLIAAAPFKNITALRVEALSDSRLPAGGPGRAGNGGFVLSKIAVTTAIKEAKDEKPGKADMAPKGDNAKPKATTAPDSKATKDEKAVKPAADAKVAKDDKEANATTAAKTAKDDKEANATAGVKPAKDDKESKATDSKVAKDDKDSKPATDTKIAVKDDNTAKDSKPATDAKDTKVTKEVKEQTKVAKDDKGVKTTADTKPALPVEFTSAFATSEQPNHSAASALTDAKEAGWSAAGAGRPVTATFIAKDKFATEASTVLTIALDQKSSAAQNTLGHFRIWATSNADPAAAITLPPDIAAIFKSTAEKRTEKQKTELADYYRSIAPSLDPVRHRLAELKGETQSSLTLLRGKKFAVPFLLNRSGFTGDVQVTIDGFIAGRDPNTGAPTPVSGAFKVEPLNLTAGKASGTLNVEVERQSGFGARYCVLRAEGKAGNEAKVEYSAPFVVTVLEK